MIRVPSVLAAGTQRWTWLAAAAVMLTAAAAFAAPARADRTDDNFIDALNHAGVDFGEPGIAMSLGQSICPMLAQPGGSFAAAAASIGRHGVSAQTAQTFTTIAIQTYCPDEMANIANTANTANGNLSGALPGGGTGGLTTGPYGGPNGGLRQAPGLRGAWPQPN